MLSDPVLMETVPVPDKVFSVAPAETLELSVPARFNPLEVEMLPVVPSAKVLKVSTVVGPV